MLTLVTGQDGPTQGLTAALCAASGILAGLDVFLCCMHLALMHASDIYTASASLSRRHRRTYQWHYQGKAKHDFDCSQMSIWSRTCSNLTCRVNAFRLDSAVKHSPTCDPALVLTTTNIYLHCNMNTLGASTICLDLLSCVQCTLIHRSFSRTRLI